jgi:pyruvate formate lyase activating enzyme
MARADSTRGTLFNIQRFSLHDGPGIRTTVFLKGCPLRCAWCHNPESQAAVPELIFREGRCIACGACVENCPDAASAITGGRVTLDRSRCRACGVCAGVCYAEAREIVGRDWTVGEVMAEIVRDLAFFDQSGGGVTFSGGEPLYQPAFLGALLEACRAQEIHTAVDTSGLAPWETLEAIRPNVDLFLYDLKLMDDAKHRLYTGASNRQILSNLQALAERGAPVHVRVPIIPGVNDDPENIRLTGEFLASLPNLRGLTVLAYHQIGIEKYNSLGMSYSMESTRVPGDEMMAQIAHTLRGYGLPAAIGG